MLCRGDQEDREIPEPNLIFAVAGLMRVIGLIERQSALNALAVILLSLPCAVGYNLLSGFQPRGAGSTVLDLEDFLIRQGDKNKARAAVRAYAIGKTSREDNEAGDESDKGV